MSKCKPARKIDDPSAARLLAQLSPTARRQFLELQLASDFPAFVMKVFETVSSGDGFLSNWHIDAMTYAARRVVDG